MPSVLIKGMWMPKHCWQCRFQNSEDLCVLLDDDCMKIWGEQNRLPNCPLIEVPDHGDLIDRDSLKAELGITDWECDKCQWGGQFGCKRDDFNEACFFLENADVVIPAER